MYNRNLVTESFKKKIVLGIILYMSLGYEFVYIYVKCLGMNYGREGDDIKLGRVG